MWKKSIHVFQPGILIGTNIQICQCISPWLGLSRSSDVSRNQLGRGSSDGDKRKYDSDSSEEEDIDGVAIEDAGAKKQKVTIGFNKTFGSIKTIGFAEKKNPAPITIKLGAQVRYWLVFSW